MLALESVAASDAAAGSAAEAIVVVVNPRAARVDSRTMERALRALDREWDVEVRRTEDPGHAAELARDAAAAGATAVAAFGGDGTANEVANGLSGTDAAIACLPAGRTNSFARTLGLPMEPVAAAAALRASSARVRSVDLGVVAGRRFLCVSALGALATAAGNLSRRTTFVGSAAAAYFAAASVASAGGQFVRGGSGFSVLGDEEPLHAAAGVVQNAAPATWCGRRPIHVCDAGHDTGTLVGAFLTRSMLRDLPTLAARAAWGRRGALLAHPHVRAVAPTPRLSVRASSGEPVAVEADGEFLGRFEQVEYEAAPAALRVLG